MPDTDLSVPRTIECLLCGTFSLELRVETKFSKEGDMYWPTFYRSCANPKCGADLIDGDLVSINAILVRSVKQFVKDNPHVKINPT